ncbi:hypothetical protein Patl1_29323 [Pistacia atlantica]|uniref:Uncharacterized protein n=1 Tax=Pistacia atlantica TaxID=434234 RepID=A0ACC1BDG2_9ROSI|nr:hypothetical protein Patl1_29323 [Pistacia atlantica]
MYSDREEGEDMNMANIRLAFSGDGAAVYKPLMPTDAFQQSPQPPTGDISFLHQHQHQHQHPQQDHHQAPVNSLSVSGSIEAGKRKRGRPRKYGPDATNNTTNNNNNNNNNNSSSSNNGIGGLNLTSTPSAVAVAVKVASSSSNSNKKPRGRPPGSTSSRKHSAGFGSAGVGFTPHVITVQAGEDVLAKVMSFSQNGPRAVCILSANGAISNVTLRQAMTSGGTVTYESFPICALAHKALQYSLLLMQGRFEILSLSGSILLSESGGQRSRTGGLSVSLAGPDGRVLGGGVAGLLTAASPVQVIVGSFLAEGWKDSKSGIQVEPLSSTPKHVGGASGVGSPPSRGNFSESSGGGGSPLNQSTGGCSNSNPAGIPNISWK